MQPELELNYARDFVAEGDPGENLAIAAGVTVYSLPTARRMYPGRERTPSIRIRLVIRRQNLSKKNQRSTGVIIQGRLSCCGNCGEEGLRKWGQNFTLFTFLEVNVTT
jgi:hypothetical protein